MTPQICDKHEDCLVIYEFLTSCPVCKLEEELEQAELESNYWQEEADNYWQEEADKLEDKLNDSDNKRRKREGV